MEVELDQNQMRKEDSCLHNRKRRRREGLEESKREKTEGMVAYICV